MDEKKKQPSSRASTYSMGQENSQNSFPEFLVQAHKKSKNIIIINNHYYYHYQYHYFSPAAASSSQLPSHAS